MSESKDLSELRKKVLEEAEEAKSALRVDGYHGVLNIFDDDIFLLDYWNYEQGINYLVGIADIYLEEDEDGSADFKEITTLDHDFYLQKEQSHIIQAFKNILHRLRRIWDSGGHPDSNPPWYYIEWAISKNHKIPWLDYAIEKGFYKLIKSSEEQPLSDKERETLLVIIAALAKEAEVDIAKISKAGDLIANMTQLIGAPIGATTIETHLKKIPQALASRTK